MNVTKIAQKMKNKRLMIMKKILQNEKKYFIKRKYFNLEYFSSLQEKVSEPFLFCTYV